MSRENILPDGLHDSTEHGYTHAVVENGTAYISGQVGTNAEGEIVSDDVEGQARQTFENIGYILDELEKSFDDIAKETVYLTNVHNQKEAYDKVKDEFFGDSYPASTLVGVDDLAWEGLLVEVDVEVPIDE
jgi:2-iminobutanoate/2-iminopropanoate deaminase